METGGPFCRYSAAPATCAAEVLISLGAALAPISCGGLRR